MSEIQRIKERLDSEWCKHVYGKSINQEQVFEDIDSLLILYEALEKANSWRDASVETPPFYTEVLVKSPKGDVSLASWREAYRIFTCQNKQENVVGWQWKLIN